MQRVCLVTGASRGIGAAIADALGAAGATVVGTATTEAGAAAISGRFAANGIVGTGIDLSRLFTEQAKRRAEELGVAAQVRFIHDDAAGYVADEKVEVTSEKMPKAGRTRM